MAGPGSTKSTGEPSRGQRGPAPTGISAEDLLDRLTDGTGIQDLLDAKSQVAAQLSSSQDKGSLVDGYARRCTHHLDTSPQ